MRGGRLGGSNLRARVEVDKRVVKAKKAGAKVIHPPFDVPTVGPLAILKQPGGGVVRWMTPEAV